MTFGIDSPYRNNTSNNSGNRRLDSQQHVTINSADFPVVSDVQKQSCYAPLPAIHFSIPYPFLPNAQKHNDNATAKKQNYLHPFTGIRNQNNHDLCQAEPRYKPRHDLAVSESKTDRNPVYVGQNKPIRDPRKSSIKQNTASLHQPSVRSPSMATAQEVGTRTASYFFFPSKSTIPIHQARAMKMPHGYATVSLFSKNPDIFSPKDKHQKSFHPVLLGTLPALRQIMASSPRRWLARFRECSCPKHQSCCPSCRRSMLPRPSARLSSAELRRSGSGFQRC
jgi:hypothetical protein